MIRLKRRTHPAQEKDTHRENDDAVASSCHSAKTHHSYDGLDIRASPPHGTQTALALTANNRDYGACGVTGLGVFVGEASPKNITSELPPVFDTHTLPLGSTARV